MTENSHIKDLEELNMFLLHSKGIFKISCANLFHGWLFLELYYITVLTFFGENMSLQNILYSKNQIFN